LTKRGEGGRFERARLQSRERIVTESDDRHYVKSVYRQDTQ